MEAKHTVTWPCFLHTNTDESLCIMSAKRLSSIFYFSRVNLRYLDYHNWKFLKTKKKLLHNLTNYNIVSFYSPHLTHLSKIRQKKSHGSCDNFMLFCSLCSWKYENAHYHFPVIYVYTLFAYEIFFPMFYFRKYINVHIHIV